MALADYMLPLKNEILTDPLGIGYSTMTDQQVADALNAETREQHKRVPLSEIHDWASAKRLYKRFVDNNIEGGALHNELLTLLKGKQTDVNLQSQAEGVSGLITDLVANGIMTSEEVTELQSLGITYISRAAEIGFNRTVSAHAVSMCREVA